MSTTNVDDVLTHDDLDDFLGGQLSNGAIALPPAWSGSSAVARQTALDDILIALSRRIPRISEADLADVTELKTATKYGAAAHIAMLNVTRGGDDPVWAFKFKEYDRMFKEEMSSLQVTVGGGYEVPADVIRVSRG